MQPNGLRASLGGIGKRQHAIELSDLLRTEGYGYQATSQRSQSPLALVQINREWASTDRHIAELHTR